MATPRSFVSCVERSPARTSSGAVPRSGVRLASDSGLSPSQERPADSMPRSERARRAFTPFSAIGIEAPSRSPTPLDAAPRLGSGLSQERGVQPHRLAQGPVSRGCLAGSRPLLGARGIVASSTGNHGVSAAAHAAAAGIAGRGLLSPRGAGRSAARDRRVRGDRGAGAAGRAAKCARVARRGRLVPGDLDGSRALGRRQPIRRGGYKETAYETVEQLGRNAGRILHPTAGGDTYYGIRRGLPSSPRSPARRCRLFSRSSRRSQRA